MATKAWPALFVNRLARSATSNSFTLMQNKIPPCLSVKTMGGTWVKASIAGGVGGGRERVKNMPA